MAKAPFLATVAAVVPQAGTPGWFLHVGFLQGHAVGQRKQYLGSNATPVMKQVFLLNFWDIVG